MKSAALSKLGKNLRRPWYFAWRLIERVFFSDCEYTLHVPYGHRIFTPWFDLNSKSEFAEIINSVRQSGPLLVSPDRCHILYRFARHCTNIHGEIAECGVYSGGTAEVIARVLSGHAPYKKLHLFDTFVGMPATSFPERDYHSAGDFADTSLQKVAARLEKYRSLCEFHVGLIPDTFAEVETVNSYCFVHVDVDIYPSIQACCNWFWPRLAPGGIMIFDDYGFFPYRYAARAAVDEYFADKQEKPIPLPTGQAIVIRTCHEHSVYQHRQES